MSEDAKPEAVKEKRKRGPNKPLQGKFEIEFLQEAKAPDRKPLQGGGSHGPRETVLTDILGQLKEAPGKLAVVFSSPDREEVFRRRTSLLIAAERLGIKMDETNTCSREIPGKAGVYGLYAMVAAS